MIESMRESITKKEAIMRHIPVEYKFRPELNTIFGKGGVIQQSNPSYN